eukprot:412906-Prorocentrum_minimum.AAC.2
MKEGTGFGEWSPVTSHGEYALAVVGKGTTPYNDGTKSCYSRHCVVSGVVPRAHTVLPRVDCDGVGLASDAPASARDRLAGAAHCAGEAAAPPRPSTRAPPSPRWTPSSRGPPPVASQTRGGPP